MALGDEDLDLFVSDFAHDVFFNGSLTPVKALVEFYDERVVEGQMQTASIGRVKAITCKTEDVSGIGIGDEVVVSTVSYFVRQPLLIQEGAFTHFLLSNEEQ